MQSTKPSLFGKLAASIHQPLVDKQSTTRLLQSLSASFRKHLSKDAIQTARAHGNHFENMLQHPIFTSPPRPHSSTSPAKAAYISIQQSIRHGTLDQSTLGKCLTTIVQNPQIYQETEYGSKIFKLLVNSGTDLNTLDSKTSARLLELLFQDNNFGLADRWIISTQSARQLSQYLHHCISERNETFATETILRLIPSLKDGTCRGIVAIARHLLSHLPAVTEIPTSSFTQLLSAAKRVSYVSPRAQFTYATLALFNTESGVDPGPALQFFKNPKSQYEFSHARISSLQLALKAAEVLIQHDKYEEASWLLDFTKERFPTELELNNAPSKSKSKSKSNESSPSIKQTNAVLNQLNGLLSTV